MSGRPPRSSTGKTKVVELLERNKNVQLPQPPPHATSPYVTAHCEGLWARTLMTVRCLPPVDVPGPGLSQGGAFTQHEAEITLTTLQGRQGNLRLVLRECPSLTKPWTRDIDGG